jgi:multicomponent Na+:H+ antiporter subunit D
MNYLLPLFVIVPLGAAFLTPILARFWKGLPDWLGNAVALFLAGFSIWMIPCSAEGLRFFAGGWNGGGGEGVLHILGIEMVLDGLSVLMLLVINVVGFLVTLYSINYMSHYTDKGKYYTLFLLMLAGLNGVVLAGDMFNLFVFLEITAISSYALVAFGVEAEELEASFKYQVLGGTASALILLGIALFYHTTGTLNFARASEVMSGVPDEKLAPVVFLGVLFLVGFSLKAALMPFHAWLPDAHPSAPAPISAMLSGVVIKVLGVYTLIRLFLTVFPGHIISELPTIFLVLGTLSMAAGAFLALGQKDLKRLLAYSSISQIGYVIFALGLQSELGYLGALFHMLNHANFKSLLFLNSGAVVYRTDTREMERLGGLSQRMPVTGTTSLVGALSISGIPPLAGFWSKLVIVLAAIQAEQYALAAVAILVSVITLMYYMKFQRFTFFGELKKTYENLKEAPAFMCISMIVLALLTIGLGLLLLPQLRSAILDPAVKVITGVTKSTTMALGG